MSAKAARKVGVVLLGLIGCVGVMSGCAADPVAAGKGPVVQHRGSLHSRFVPLALPARRVVARSAPVAILTYHRVAHLLQEKVPSIPDETVEPFSFFSQLRALKRARFHTITQRQLFEALVRGSPLPRRAVMITVDDGYRDDVRRILPALRYFGFVATFYVISGRTHEPGFLTAAEIRRLDKAGMDIGAHTRSHVPLATLSPAGARQEIRGSRAALQRILGHPVYWFAYPFGSFDLRVERQVGAAGFLMAATTRAGSLPSSRELLALPRIHVSRASTPEEVVAMAGSPTALRGVAAGESLAGSG